MAGRIGPVARVAGGAAAVLVAALTLGTLVAVAMRAEDAPQLGPADFAAIRFTMLQATLSALFSVALAIPVARALARRSFPGRGLLVTLLGAPFILPVIVAVLGLLAVFGRNGLISQGLMLLGFEPVHIYGLHGVVLAHVFFNLPLATRLILQGWLAIPAERFRLAASLGLSPRDVARTLEWPMLRAVLPGAALVIFLICTTSFAVALALGGGPRGTTVELAIYQAFRFEFDLGSAALLSLIQFAICATAALAVWWVDLPAGFGGGLGRVTERWAISGPGLRALDALAIGLAALFLLTPLAMIVAEGIPRLADLPASVISATGRSFAVALSAAVLTIVLALSLATLALGTRGWKTGAVEALAVLSIAVSPLVIGTGLFLVIYPFADPISLALPITALVNALMSLPFAYRALAPALAEAETVHGRLADSLGMRGWARLKHLILPRLMRPLGFAAGLAAALSMGDLGVIALFANPEQATLPMEMYGLMASFRMEQASSAALLLLVCSMGLFWVFDRGGRVRAAT
ncbi:thiamine/thiamine pyrophosphate ABC transporter permease ThiP [Psychromarinibacter sp. C21-152]|uniref:Thiamine/thiamine pyrophosphate ABC transporter permease ThiP n=1 Tax=Psychromarinibacter sediminicola TaxID=3033385 RepID=A0AAE3T6K5_9RHOB|nr:thiamine/thiamine pyrophosphate ABC transporter permease ThiP [Psychromarinibacter sediminicola]MDF0599390.1 thiamine/thiamine pyrophosphate ABC transporter permease ThiP [Psychromarinibacter sediminicola]